MLAPEMALLLNTLVQPEARWRFLRHVLQDATERGATARLSGQERHWVEGLAAVPTAELLQHLRAHAPAELASIDAVASRLIPVAERLGRVAPDAPVHLCLVGRSALLDDLVQHPAFEAGGHVHLHGPRASGRSLVAAQMARQAVDVVPVVAWLDGRTRAGLSAGLNRLAGALGLPTVPRTQRSAQMTSWLVSQPDWCVVVDDAPASMPPCLHSPIGRLLTVGVAPRPDADANIRLPELDSDARAEVVRRWSRGRAPQLPDTLPLGELVIVAAAYARGATGITAVAGAVESLSSEARMLAALLQAFAAAPVPFAMLGWPDHVPIPDHVPAPLRPLLRSERICRDAASMLVRAGWAHWAGDALRSRAVDAADEHLAAAPDLAARLVVHALQSSEIVPEHWWPHARWLSDDPAVPPNIRRAIAARAGRKALEAHDPSWAVGWFQGALAAFDGDPAHGGESGASLLNDLGVAWRRSGRLEEAAAVFRDALALDEDREGANVLAVASTRMNLAHILRDQGNMAGAHSLYQSVAAVRRAQLGETDPETAAAFIQLGVTAQATGDLPAARQAWDDAIRGLSRTRPVPRVLLASALQLQARLEAGFDRLEAAQRLAQRAYTLLMAEHDDIDHPAVVRVRDLVGLLDLHLESRQSDG